MCGARSTLPLPCAFSEWVQCALRDCSALPREFRRCATGAPYTARYSPVDWPGVVPCLLVTL